MKKKISLFLCIIMLSSFIVSSAEVKTDTIKPLEQKEGTVKQENNDDYEPGNGSYEENFSPDDSYDYSDDGEDEDNDYSDDHDSNDNNDYNNDNDNNNSYDNNNDNGNKDDNSYNNNNNDNDYNDYDFDYDGFFDGEIQGSDYNPYAPGDDQGSGINNDFMFDYSPGNPNGDYYDDGSFNFMMQEDNDYSEYDEGSKKEPKMTLHYTTDIDTKYPVYTDTGIPIEKNTFLTESHVTEFLTQIAVKENGKVVEDKNKSLLILDGKTTVVVEGETAIDDIDISVNDNAVSLKVQESRVGGRYELAEKLEKDKYIPVIINEKEVDLESEIDPLIDGSRVLFPVRVIAEELGGEVSWNEDKEEASIKYKDKVITIEGNGDKVMVGNKELKLPCDTQLDSEQDKLFSLIQAIVTEMDSEMYYETNKEVLVIETPSVIKELNNW